jgi:ribosomal protein S18 acetylase RimI-like enzyme
MADDARNARIRQWLRTVIIARSDRVIEIAGGVAVLHSEFPQAHDHNRLLLRTATDAAGVAAAADEVLGGAGLEHRLVDVDDIDVADRLAPGLASFGYERSDSLVMTYDGAEPPPSSSGTVSIDQLDLAERSAVATADWQAEQPDWTPDVAVALGERTRTLSGAVTPTFLAVRRDHVVVARADLYRSDDIAQVEEVMTDPSARRQGFASALVREATSRAIASGAQTVFLIADADDGAAPLYRTLGFADAFRMASFHR